MIMHIRDDEKRWECIKDSLSRPSVSHAMIMCIVHRLIDHLHRIHSQIINAKLHIHGAHCTWTCSRYSMFRLATKCVL